ncbi:unnamed protein product [Paramecium primaurelia]|uniref:Uncharacterized protein n=1 Tax=Paramecium primaurelia TaxID=5886 RepID=A0A8S1QNW6_PARPR|nr:unnamed protein product [Paramecium primaurelia]
MHFSIFLRPLLQLRIEKFRDLQNLFQILKTILFNFPQGTHMQSNDLNSLSTKCQIIHCEQITHYNPQNFSI